MHEVKLIPLKSKFVFQLISANLSEFQPPNGGVKYLHNQDNSDAR